MKIRRAVIAIVLCVLASTGCGGQKNPEAEQAALEAAGSWLAIVDGGDYAASWSEAAVFFQGAITREKWQEGMTTFRKPLGPMLSREVKSMRYVTTMPGAPDGEYVIVQFRASFENKKKAIETVTPMKETNGLWRVSGYYIK